MELTSVRGLGQVRLASLRAMGIDSLRDLLLFLPRSYDDLTQIVPLGQLGPGQALVRGKIVQKPVLNRFQGLVRVTTALEDATGRIQVVFYNQPWTARQMAEGREVTLFGRVTERKGQLVLQNPETVTDLGIRPVYRPVKGIPDKTLHSIILSCFPAIPEACPETLPERIRQEHHLPAMDEAIRACHEPRSMDELRRARRRMAFEQMLMYQAAVGLMGDNRQEGPSMTFPPDAEEAFWSRLGFAPTSAQRRVLTEIRADMEKKTAMARLVQGDVGCGKTAIALGAISLCLEAGYQAAMMVPTEILARQHYETCMKLLGSHTEVGLLIGSLKPSEKARAHAMLASGTWRVVIGTHALISEKTAYENLGLVITDEQHRFGVRQRSSLQGKGGKEGRMPHVLVMSATPIPRSLALILYGDLDVSVVNELPPGRTPVKTKLVPEEKRRDMYGFIRRQVEAGRQAYVVCPLVEDSETMDDIRSAQATYEELCRDELRGLKVGLTYGEQKAEEKQQVLESFARGTTDVLVSTTVIEVGVNVPNASVMVVENAERFGLSQLHQLRGRVGRGTQESWCFLMARGTEKLRILAQTHDGFEVAQKDLELRGPGELMGTRQSGQEVEGLLMDGDIRLLEEAVQCMKQLRQDDSFRQERECIEAEAWKRYADKVRSTALN